MNKNQLPKDLFQENPHKGNGAEYVLSAYKGYSPDAFWQHISTAQYTAIMRILNQQHSRYIHQEGVEVTLLFTAQDTSENRQVAVYIADDFEIATCPLDEFHDEFSKI